MLATRGVRGSRRAMDYELYLRETRCGLQAKTMNMMEINELMDIHYSNTEYTIKHLRNINSVCDHQYLYFFLYLVGLEPSPTSHNSDTLSLYSPEVTHIVN